MRSNRCGRIGAALSESVERIGRERIDVESMRRRESGVQQSSCMTSIERRIDVDAPASDVWPLLGDPEGWARWLADEADVDVRPGGRGRLVEDGAVRRVEVDHVEAGRRV